MHVNVSNLEAFHLMRTQDWMTWERFKEQLTKKAPVTEGMLLGRAVHKVLENLEHYANDARSDFVLVEDRRQDVKHYFYAENLLDLLEVFPPDKGFCELPVTKEYNTGFGKITLSGRVDKVLGSSVTDYKVSDKPPQLQMYQDSLQWRAYLDMLDCHRFEYLFFKLERFDEDMGPAYWINFTGSFQQYATSDLEEQIRYWLIDYVATLREHSLDKYLLQPRRRNHA